MENELHFRRSKEGRYSTARLFRTCWPVIVAARRCFQSPRRRRFDPMDAFRYTKHFMAAAVISLLVFAGLSRPAYAQSDETANMLVVVKDSATGEPISQALITLQFKQPGGASRFGKSKKLSYSAKTDAQGRYKFTDINKGPIVLSVTADDHQSYGKQLRLEKDNQVFLVKLKKPQPLI
jgi:Carboxypeptidase regulatory-like domain